MFKERLLDLQMFLHGMHFEKILDSVESFALLMMAKQRGDKGNEDNYQ